MQGANGIRDRDTELMMMNIGTCGNGYFTVRPVPVYQYIPLTDKEAQVIAYHVRIYNLEERAVSHR